MHSNSLHALYRCFVESEQPIDPAFQVGMVRNLIAGEEFSLLAKFAVRPDVSPEADVLIKGCDSPQVVAGWASRPGTDPADVLERLSGEKRVTALLPLASASNLPPEVYGMLLAKGSSKITKALLENANIPREARKRFLPGFVAAIENPGHKGRLYHRVGELRKFIGEDVDMTLGVLAVANDPVVLSGALEILEEDFPARDAEGVAIVVSRVRSIVSLRIESGLTTIASCEASGLHEFLEALGLKELDPAQLKEVRAALAIVATRFKKLKCAYLLKDAKNGLSPRGRQGLAEVAELASTADTERAHALIKKLITAPRSDDGPHYAKAVAAAVNNTSLPVDLILPIGEDLDDGERRVLVTRWLKDGRTEAAARLLVEEYYADACLDDIDDSSALLTLLEATVRIAVEEDMGIPYWVLRHRALLNDPKLALSLLPWKSISEVADSDPFDFDDVDDVETATTYGQPQAKVATTDRVYQTAQRVIADRLGSDVHKWETFALLAEEFEGTLPDLLHAAVSL